MKALVVSVVIVMTTVFNAFSNGISPSLLITPLQTEKK